MLYDIFAFALPHRLHPNPQPSLHAGPLDPGSHRQPSAAHAVLSSTLPFPQQFCAPEPKIYNSLCEIYECVGFLMVFLDFRILQYYR